MIPVANPLAQYEALREDIDGAIKRVLEGGRYVLGPEVEAFETAFASYLGVRHGIGTNSGTDAITIALRALDVGPGDLVATVSHTAVATIAAVVATGATPLLVDIDPATYTMSADSLEASLDERVKAVVPVHLYGGIADIRSICEVSAARGIPVVEDCAQAAGLSFDGRKAGSFGAAACFSFYPTKNLGALGDGGMIVTSDDAFAQRARRLRQYGWDDTRTSEEPSGNSRLDEIQAAILRVKLPHLDGWNERRRDIAARYSAALRNEDLSLPMAPDDHVFHLYVVATDDREGLRDGLAHRGIQTALHYPVPAHRDPGYADVVKICKGGLTETERAADRVLSLPLFPELTDADVEEVLEAIGGSSLL